MINIFAEERCRDGTGEPLGPDIDARDIAGDAGMARMSAETDQMDLAESCIVPGGGAAASMAMDLTSTMLRTPMKRIIRPG